METPDRETGGLEHGTQAFLDALTCECAAERNPKGREGQGCKPVTGRIARDERKHPMHTSCTCPRAWNVRHLPATLM